MFGSNWLSESIYQYDDGSSKHWSAATGQYPAAFRSNDVFVGIGPTFAPTSRFSWTPEAEAEYRQWHRGLPEAEYEIIENYTFWAPGGGVRAAYNPVGRLVVTARAGLAHTVYPTNAGIGNPAGQVPNVTFSLGTRNVWQANLGADYAIGHRIHAFAGIDYSHFGFGRSESEPGGPEHPPQYEPNSVTDLAKVNVGAAWSF
jgi:opacity protein-like surface antigen